MAFKLPSINGLFGHIIKTIRRFPFEVLFALAGTYAAVSISTSYYYGYYSNGWYVRILMMAAVSMPLSL